MSTERIGVGAWLLSFPRAVGLLARGSIRLDRSRLGSVLTMSDGRSFTLFRATFRTSAQESEGQPAVLQPRFHLRFTTAGPSRRHRVFRRVCIVTTPFFVGLRGFRSKRWMYDDATGEYAGLYEWDDAPSARAYAEGLCKVLRLFSVTGSVSYELVESCSVNDYLDAHSPDGKSHHDHVAAGVVASR